MWEKIYIFKKCTTKRFYIKRLNFLNSPIFVLDFRLENYYIQCKTQMRLYSDDNNSNMEYIPTINLINQLSDTSEINLDTTNIKEIPIKLLYKFEITLRGFNSEKELEERLNNFICTKNFNDPFLFDINTYMNKKAKKLLSRIPKPILKYIKYSEHFFTFCLKYYVKHPVAVDGILRIDCIYSENFDRIFIGKVNKDEKYYVQTFESRIDIIDKFVLQKFKNFGNGYDLKVMYKDQQIQTIWPIENKTQEELEGLVYFLNERLNKEKTNEKNNRANNL